MYDATGGKIVSGRWQLAVSGINERKSFMHCKSKNGTRGKDPQQEGEEEREREREREGKREREGENEGGRERKEGIRYYMKLTR